MRTSCRSTSRSELKCLCTILVLQHLQWSVYCRTTLTSRKPVSKSWRPELWFLWPFNDVWFSFFTFYTSYALLDERAFHFRGKKFAEISLFFRPVCSILDRWHHILNRQGRLGKRSKCSSLKTPWYRPSMGVKLLTPSYWAPVINTFTSQSKLFLSFSTSTSLCSHDFSVVCEWKIAILTSSTKSLEDLAFFKV